MQKELKMLSIVYVFTLFMLFVPNFFSTEIYGMMYFLSLLLPLLLGVFYCIFEKKKGELFAALTPNKAIFKTLPCVAPTLFVVTGVSYLTTLLLTALTGRTNALELGESLPLALLVYALLPSVMEELLFRFLPLALIGKRSPRLCILFSATAFALVHHSFFSIPHAFVAGVVFMAIDLFAGSVYPSLIAHFLNNVLSVIWIMYSGEVLFSFFYFGTLLLFALLSFFIVFIKRREYLPALRTLLSGRERYETVPEAALLLFATLLMAIFEFF